MLLDHKYANAEDYFRYTKCELPKVERFLDELEKRRIETWLRRVIIPGLNDDEASALQLKDVAEKYACVTKTELLPFRKLCIEKYRSLGIPFPLENIPEASEETVKKLYKTISGTA